MAILRAVISGTYYGQRVQNVLHFKKADFVDSEKITLATELRDVWVFNIKGLQNIGFTYTTITVQKKDPSPGMPYLLDIATYTGENTGAGAVSVIALLWTLRTDDPTHRGRGRVYMGGVHGATPLAGLVHPGVVSTMTSFATTVMNKWGPSGTSVFDLVVGPNHYEDPTDFKPVTSMVPRNYFGVQRRRNIGVGA